MGRTARRTLLVALLASGPLAAAWSASAAPFEEAPEESREQVRGALETLGKLLRSPRRTVVAGSPGTLEEVIGKFAPAKFHPVDEGVVRPRTKGGACPTEMALVAERVCVDKWEAALFVRKDDGSEETLSPFEAPPTDRVYFARSSAGATPQAYIKGSEAERACRAAKKRLCDAAEWRAACGGSQGLAFPYGKKRVPGRCRDKGTAPMMVFHASTLKKGWGKVELNDPRLNQLPDTVSKTGSHEGCVNDYGLFDMVGNLHEWTADSNGTFQGGYYLDTSQHGEGCAYRTIAHPFDYSDYSIGFRCCADPTEAPPSRTGAADAGARD